MRGFSQEDMAGRLKIAQNTYSKIEGNKQKVTTEMLDKIAKELGVTVPDIISQEPIVINNINNHASNTGAQSNIEHFYADQKELYEKLIASKDKEIANLLGIVESQREILDKTIAAKDAEIGNLHTLIDSLMNDKGRLMDLLDKKL